MKSKLPRNLPPCYRQVFSTIGERTKLNPIQSAELEQLFNITGAQVREIVHYFRYEILVPIASSNKGYWLARTLKEWEQTTHHLKSRAVNLLSGLDRITRANFNGQQSLF